MADEARRLEREQLLSAVEYHYTTSCIKRQSPLNESCTYIQYSMRNVLRSDDSSARRFPAHEVAINRRIYPRNQRLLQQGVRERTWL